jgi:hypothetical protein
MFRWIPPTWPAGSRTLDPLGENENTFAMGGEDSSGHNCHKRPDEGRPGHAHGLTPGKWPLAGAGKELAGLPNSDRIGEKAHGGRGPEFIRVIPV